MLNPKLLTVAALAAGLALSATASTGVAQQADKPAAQLNTWTMGGGMTGMMEMMGQMNRMMGSCNQMMQSMMQQRPPQPGATTPEKKG